MKQILENILLTVSMDQNIDKGEIKSADRLILHSVMKGLDISRAGIWLFVDGSQGISCKLLIDKYHNTEIEELTLYQKQFPRYFQELNTERTIKAHDALNDRVTHEFVDSYLIPNGITSMLDVPIRLNGKMIGIICCEHIGEQRHWSNDEATFSAALADMYSRAMTAQEKKKYQQKLENINNTLEETVHLRTSELTLKIKELEQMQEQLIESEKMAALGKLVAGVSHEVNTPIGNAITAISVIDENLEQLSKQLSEQTLSQSQLNAFIESSNKGIQLSKINLDKAAKLITNFKQIAVSLNSFERINVELHTFLEQVISTLRHDAKKHGVNIKLVCNSAITLKTYPAAIVEIISNLLLNTFHHAFDNRQNKQVDIELSINAENNAVVITFKDNGIGIEKGVLSQVIEPFYTTKRGKGNTGLGLTIIYNLVEQQLGGSFRLESPQDKGTLITIKIPYEK